jgi:hypothetical protein
MKYSPVGYRCKVEGAGEAGGDDVKRKIKHFYF